MTLSDAMVLTNTVSSPTAFSDGECARYFELLSSLPEHALVVEVGLQFGRSSSIALQVCKANNLCYWGIDSFEEDNDAMHKWIELAEKVGEPYTLSRLRSNAVIMREPIDLILIDGDHSYQGVTDDLNHFMPLVRREGYALFHDFGRHSLPEVYSAVRDYMDGNQHWREQEHVETLGIWRRA